MPILVDIKSSGRQPMPLLKRTNVTTEVFIAHARLARCVRGVRETSCCGLLKPGQCVRVGPSLKYAREIHETLKYSLRSANGFSVNFE